MNYRIKPLEWKRTNNVSFKNYSAKAGKESWYSVEQEAGGTYLCAYNILAFGDIVFRRGLTIEKAKEACQEHHDSIIREVIEKFVEIPDVIDSKAFVVSQIGAVENLIKCAQEGGDLVAVVQLKQKLQELEQELKGNGSEVMKAVAELRAELSEKDMAAIDEELKERLNIVPDPAVPEGEVWVLDKNKYLAECRKRAYGTMKDIGDPDVYLRDLRGDVDERNEDQ